MLVLPSVLMHEQARACARMLGQAVRSETGPEVVADVSALASFDSSALAVLLECRREALVSGKRFVVKAWPPRLQGLAVLYGVDELLSPGAAVAPVG